MSRTKNTALVYFSFLIYIMVYHQHVHSFMGFCYLTRLAKSNACLSLLTQHNYSFKPCNCLCKNDCIQIDSALFFNKKIIKCIEEIESTTSLKPILQLSQNINDYAFVQDHQFMRELFLLLFTIQKQILLQKCAEKPDILKKNTLATILEISEKINQLPIAEILNAIDMLVTELPPFLEKYEFHSQMSWKDWLKKYWWVPPIFGSWFTLKILLSLQRPHYYYSPYLSPRPTQPLPPLQTSDPVLAEIIVEQ